MKENDINPLINHTIQRTLKPEQPAGYQCVQELEVLEYELWKRKKLGDVDLNIPRQLQLLDMVKDVPHFKVCTISGDTRVFSLSDEKTLRTKVGLWLGTFAPFITLYDENWISLPQIDEYPLYNWVDPFSQMNDSVRSSSAKRIVVNATRSERVADNIDINMNNYDSNMNNNNFNLLLLRNKRNVNVHPSFWDDVKMILEHALYGRDTVLSLAERLCDLKIVENLKIFFEWCSPENINTAYQKLHSIRVDNRAETQSMSPIHILILSDDGSLIKKFHDTCGDINARDSTGRSPIELASKCMCMRAFAALMDLGTEVNQLQSRYFGSTLHWAITHGSVPTVELLLDAKAQTATNQAGDCGMHDHHPLMTAYENHHYQVLDLLIDRVCNIDIALVRRTELGNDTVTLLSWACMNGDLEGVKYCIKKGASINRITHPDLKFPPPLHIALEEENDDIVDYLIEMKVDVNDSCRGVPLIHTAYLQSTVANVRKLLHHGADVNTTDKEGNTLLHLCYNKKEVIEMLLSYSNVLINIQNGNGQSPLHIFATKSENHEHLKLLIQKNASIDIKDNKGNTPVYFAITNCKTKNVRVLLDNGALVLLDNEAVDKYICSHRLIWNNFDQRNVIDTLSSYGIEGQSLIPKYFSKEEFGRTSNDQEERMEHQLSKSKFFIYNMYSDSD